MAQNTALPLADLLEPIYGEEYVTQSARYGDALTEFRARYGPGPVSLFRAPGRVNVIGEHTDYNHGYVLPAALDKDVVLLARPRADRLVQAANIEADFPPTEFTLAPTIPSAARGDWSNYLRGAAQMVAAQGSPPGLDLLLAGAPPHGVPRSVGLSSSSAVVVAMAVAAAHFAGIPSGNSAFAQACANAEWYVGTRGGIMDHFAAILSRRDHALFLDCRPTPTGEYHTRHVPFPASHRLLVMDSGVHHDNVRGEYNLRVAACRAALGLLKPLTPGATHLRDIQAIPWRELSPHLPEVATPAQLAGRSIDLGEIPGLAGDTPLRIQACCRHVWSENQRVLTALDELGAGNMRRVGELLTEAHISARDDYAISTPELDHLVDTAIHLDGVAGARLTGAGWGGCVVVLVETEATDDVQAYLAHSFQSRFHRLPAALPLPSRAGRRLRRPSQRVSPTS